MDVIFIGRQPILNDKQIVVGYELLCSDGEEGEYQHENKELSPQRLLFNIFMDIGLENIVGSHLAFIPLPFSFYSQDNPLPILREQLILELEIPNDDSTDEQVVERFLHFQSEGYRIALRNFHHRATLESILEQTDYVTIAVQDHDSESLNHLVESIRHHKAQIIACGVDTQDQLEICNEAGITLYRGFYFSKPQIIEGQPLPSNRLVMLNLLAKMQQPDTEFVEIEELIVQDPTLAYRLLRYINCASFALRTEIESIHHAVMLLGIHNIRNWVSMLMLSNIDSNKPAELLVSSLVRAKMCELLAGRQQRENRDQYFTVGLLSNLNVQLDRPMDDLLDHISLATPIKLALMDHSGELGETLAYAIEYERGNWMGLKQQPINIDEYRESYLEAIRWADENISAMSSAASA